MNYLYGWDIWHHQGVSLIYGMLESGPQEAPDIKKERPQLNRDMQDCLEICARNRSASLQIISLAIAPGNAKARSTCFG